MGLCKKVPLYFVLPSASRASLASLGTASLSTSFGTTSRDVIPRSVSAEGPLVLRLGATKKGARGDKKGGSGRQKKGLGATTGGLAQIFNTASNKPIAFIFRFVIF